MLQMNMSKKVPPFSFLLLGFLLILIREVPCSSQPVLRSTSSERLFFLLILIFGCVVGVLRLRFLGNSVGSSRCAFVQMDHFRLWYVSQLL